MKTTTALTLKTPISSQTNKKPKAPDKNARSGLMAAAIMPHNRLHSREKVLVFLEGRSNPLPWLMQERGLTLKEASRDRKADKFLMTLTAWKARGLFPGSNLMDEPKQINR